MLSSRALRWALAVSLCVHLVLLLAGRGYWLAWLDSETPEEEIFLAARILPPPLPKPKPVAPKPKVQATPKAASTQPPVAPAPVAPLPAPAIGTPVTPAGAAVSAAGQGAAEQAGAPALAPGRTLPNSGRMRFSVTKGDAAFIVGKAVHEWKVDGDHYELSSNIETTGLVALFADVRLGQFSRGRVDVNGLHPETFRDNRKGGQYRSEFDWAQGVLKMGNGTVVPLAPGAQDVLSMFYQFALFPLDGPELSLMVTTGRKFERYVFKIKADEPLLLNRQTDDFPIKTYHLSYRGREEEGVDVWLARDMDRLPVKIRYTDRKGGVTELTAEAVDYTGKP